LTSLGRPAPPGWLQVLPTRHRGIAYAFGVPDTNATRDTIEVLARERQSFRIVRRVYRIEIEQPAKDQGDAELHVRYCLVQTRLDKGVSNNASHSSFAITSQPTYSVIVHNSPNSSVRYRQHLVRHMYDRICVI
jgi:hypothetical protein